MFWLWRITRQSGEWFLETEISAYDEVLGQRGTLGWLAPDTCRHLPGRPTPPECRRRAASAINSPTRTRSAASTWTSALTQKPARSPGGRRTSCEPGQLHGASPSGTGLRIFCLGRLPPAGGAKADEMYQEGRFLTTTGSHYGGTPRTVKGRTDEIQALHSEFFPAEAHKAADRAHRSAAPVLTEAKYWTCVAAPGTAASSTCSTGAARRPWRGRERRRRRVMRPLCLLHPGRRADRAPVLRLRPVP